MRRSALRAGDYDVARIPLNKIKTLKDAGFTIDLPGGTSWDFISFNNRNPRPPFDNIKVREAVAYALDRTQIMKVDARRLRHSRQPDGRQGQLLLRRRHSPPTIRTTEAGSGEARQDS